MANGFVIAATHSGAGKSLISMALLRAFQRRGFNMAAAKTGPDYIDPAFHAKAINDLCYNYDLWAMNDQSLDMITAHLAKADMVIVEGVLGLFDGPVAGIGSTADVAMKLNLPVILVVDAGAMGQSVAALIHGFSSYDKNVKIAGIIFNNVGSERHIRMLIDAVASLNIDVIGCLPRHKNMRLPSRHLGLVQADETENFEQFIDDAADYIDQHLDLNLLASKATDLLAITQNDEKNLNKFELKPLGQRISIAKDAAFTFIYPHILSQWQHMGAELSFFSPLAGQLPKSDSDAIYLPGGYPELYASQLASKIILRQKLQQMAQQDVLIYGECGGYMCLGQGLVDTAGVRHEMFGLLNVVTSFEKPKRHLGYRQLSHESALPWRGNLRGHEFHYSHAIEATGLPLFKAKDAHNEPHPDLGLQAGKIMGSYAHVIDVRT